MLYALSIYQSAVMAVLLFVSGMKNDKYPQKIIGIYLLLTSIYFVFNLLPFVLALNMVVTLLYSAIPLMLVFIPLFYLYIKSLTTRDFRITQKHLLHFIPAILICLFNLSCFIMAPRQSRSFFSGLAGDPHGTHYLYDGYCIMIIGLFILQFAFYLTRFNRVYKEYDAFIMTHFSYTRGISLQWVKVMIRVFIAIFVVNEFLEILGVDQHQAVDIINNISFLGFSLFVGYQGLRQITPRSSAEQVNQVLQQEVIMADSTERTKYQGSPLSQKQKMKLITGIERLMGTEKIFTNPKLSIQDVAFLLNTNSKYISQVLNEHYGKNFFSFINHYRVEEAKQLLSSNMADKYSILGIGQMAGFSSKSSFNEAFKVITGVTPSVYKQSGG